ncbi:MAG TPA: hypothetical protein VGM30_14605 [Puia sp.]
MYNPLPLLTEAMLRSRIGAGKRYFVRQTYPRGKEPRLRAAFLFRAYGEEEKDAAELHVQRIRMAGDPHAFLYDAEVAEHREKLILAARQPFGYKIFYVGKKGIDWKPPPEYQEKMKQYIRSRHPGWRTTREGEKIRIGLYEESGQLLLKFSFGEEEDMLPFDNIENY